MDLRRKQARLGSSFQRALTRAKSPQGANSIRRELRENILRNIDKKRVLFVYNMTLMESDPQSEGSVHILLDTFALAPS